MPNPTDQRVSSLSALAPKMRTAIELTLVHCQMAGLPVVIWETTRNQALQSYYYGLGWTPIANVWKSWHPYGLAADFTHAQLGSQAPDAFFTAVAAIAKRHGLAWGGDWTDANRDRAHLYWGECPAYVPDSVVQLATIDAGGDQLVERTGGRRAVWERYHANYHTADLVRALLIAAVIAIVIAAL